MVTYRKPRAVERAYYTPRDSTIHVNRWRQRRLIEYVHHDGYYLCLLLHEMLHAFFCIYSCRCTSCEAHKSASQGGVGAGHGPAWMDAAHTVEMAFQGLVSWKVFLALPISAQTEARVSAWQPNFEQKHKWGFRLLNSNHPEFVSVESKRHRQVSCLPIL